MAKSKKALKALKRRKAVKGRSRVVKQRQDYTLGGRVKAAVGAQPQQLYARNEGEDYDDYQARVTASQAADPNFNRNAYQQAVKTGVGAAPIPGAATTFKSTQGNLVATGNQTIATPTSDPVPTLDSVVTQPPASTKQPVVTQQPASTQQPVVAESTVTEPVDRGRRYDNEKSFSEADYQTISKAGGDTNNDGRITDEEWTNWMLGKGPTKGFETAYARKLQEVKEQGSISEQSIASIDQYLASVAKDDPDPVPDPDPVSDPVPEESTYEETREPTYVDNSFFTDPENKELIDERGYTEGYIILENLNFSGVEDRLYRRNIEKWESNNSEPKFYVDANGNPIDRDTYTTSTGKQGLDFDATAQKNPAWDRWNSARLEAHNGFINKILSLPRKSDGTIIPLEQDVFADTTRVPYRTPGLDAFGSDNEDLKRAKVATLTPEGEDASLPEDQFGEAKRIEQYEKDEEGNIVLDGSGNPVYKLQPVQEISPYLLDDTGEIILDKEGKPIPNIGTEPISADTVTAEERDTVTDDEVKTLADKFGVNAPTLKTFLSAESSYLNKYPEVKGELSKVDSEGNRLYSNIFDYHNQVGKDKDYTLDFDTTGIASSTVSRLAEASAASKTTTDAAERDRVAEAEGISTRPDFVEDTRSQVDPVTGETIVLSATPDAERQQRNAILDEVPATGTEAIIVGSVGYEAAEKRQVKGEAAKGAAVSLLQEVGELPTDIAEAILDNPASVTAQVDTAEVQVQAAIAAMPQEALVSAQLESLLAGIDEGTTPTWARPAVQLVESRLNARGMSVSTVGRDALFNAIIQTSIPIAQSNAAALQQRANQNLSNQQQANLQQSAQQMQLRLTNVANRQSAESQSATLAQQINLTQGQFTQAAQMTEAEQRQQVRIASLQNEQQASMSNLGNDQQIELANLQVEAERLGANQAAVNQERIAEMQVSANFMQKNQEFVQQMELANLSNDQQMRLSFLTAKNQAESENLTTAQQTELANLNKRLEVNKINANLAQQMGLAQLNVDQQRAMQNASTVANIDLTKFSSEQQIELSNSKFIQTATLQDLNNRQQTILQDATTLASMDLQSADSLTKVSIENARNFLSMDMANLNIEQQAYMLDSQQNQQRMLSDAAQTNAARQFNATSNLQTQQYVTSLAGQLQQFNSQQVNSLQQFNAAESNRVAAINAGNELQAEQFLAQVQTQIRQFNSQQDVQVEQFNTANAQAVEQSNVEWRRKANLADTAATNAANQQQAAFQFDLNKTALSQAWQSLRDQANFDFQEYQSDKERKVSAINAILANEAFMTEDKYNSQRANLLGLMDDFGDSLESIRSSDAFELIPEVTED